MKITDREYTVLWRSLDKATGKDKVIADNLLERIQEELLTARQRKLIKHGGLL